MYLTKTPFLLQKLYFTNDLWCVETDHNEIYLTFDDGTDTCPAARIPRDRRVLRNRPQRAHIPLDIFGSSGSRPDDRAARLQPHRTLQTGL